MSDAQVSSSSTALAKIFTSPVDSRIAHINRVLATTSGVDSTLCFIGYGLVFVSAQIANLSSPLTQIAAKVNPEASLTVAPRIADLAVSTKTLGGMCSDVRMFMRLWGLLKIWAGAKATYFNPPKDTALKVLAWGQLGAMGTYLVLENGFYLATKGVLKGWTPAKIGKWFRAAIWVFLGYLVIDYTRLWRVWQLREAAAAAAGEKEDKIELAKQDAAWWRSFQVDLAYSPLCFHWGVEGGMFTDTWTGFLGACAGFVGFRENLRLTAQ